ncbi:MAG: zinc ribbon domain-containing protein [Eubacteriales bacterium]|nr:zinc ribbon domain-containing protein [Eubacteriales bacterium]
MDKCPNCGNKLSNIDVLCPRCGAVVEVVQIKNSGSSTPPVSESHMNGINQGEKKDFPKEFPNLIVYNDDLPPEGMLGEDEDLSPGSDADAGNDIINGHHDADVEPAESEDFPEQHDDAVDLPDENEMSDEGTYSNDYLETIKNMPLPEVDSVDDFDPEEFMREYRRNRNAYNHIPAEGGADGQDSADKKFLELEEIGAAHEDADDTPEPDMAEESQPQADDVPLQENESDTQSEEDDTPNEAVPASLPYKKQRRRPLPLLLAVLIWVAVTGALFYGFVLLDRHVTDTYGGYDEFFYEISDGKIDLDTNAAYLKSVDFSVSEAQTDDGGYAHIYSIGTPDGVSVNVLPMGVAYNLTDGSADILIPDQTLFQSFGTVTYESPYLTSDVVFEIITSESSYAYTVDGLALFLYASEYSRQQPLQSISTTSEETVDIELVAAPESVVYINCSDYTDIVDAEGHLFVSLSLVLGENTITVDIMQPGRTAKRDTFTVIRQETQTTLIPDTDYLRIYNDAFTCYGTTDADARVVAQIDADAVFTAEVTADGSYTLVCTVQEYGLHDVIITATGDDKAEASVTIGVELVPELTAFSAEARELTTDDILSSAETLQNIPVKVTGRAKDISFSGSTQSFTLYTDDGDLPCYYHGTTTLEEGEAYTLYGMYDVAASAFYTMYVA